jgi:hypothetical protein
MKYFEATLLKDLMVAKNRKHLTRVLMTGVPDFRIIRNPTPAPAIANQQANSSNTRNSSTTQQANNRASNASNQSGTSATAGKDDGKASPVDIFTDLWSQGVAKLDEVLKDDNSPAATKASNKNAGNNQSGGASSAANAVNSNTTPLAEDGRAIFVPYLGEEDLSKIGKNPIKIIRNVQLVCLVSTEKNATIELQQMLSS